MDHGRTQVEREPDRELAFVAERVREPQPALHVSSEEPSPNGVEVRAVRVVPGAAGEGGEDREQVVVEDPVLYDGWGIAGGRRTQGRSAAEGWRHKDESKLRKQGRLGD